MGGRHGHPPHMAPGFLNPAMGMHASPDGSPMGQVLGFYGWQPWSSCLLFAVRVPRSLGILAVLVSFRMLYCACLVSLVHTFVMFCNGFLLCRVLAFRMVYYVYLLTLVLAFDCVLVHCSCLILRRVRQLVLGMQMMPQTAGT